MSVASHGVELPIVLYFCGPPVVRSLWSAGQKSSTCLPKRTVNIRFARWVSIHSSIDIAVRNVWASSVPVDY